MNSNVKSESENQMQPPVELKTDTSRLVSLTEQVSTLTRQLQESEAGAAVMREAFQDRLNHQLLSKEFREGLEAILNTTNAGADFLTRFKAMEVELAAFKMHELQTHVILGEILGTDDSLENKARGLVNKLTESQAELVEAKRLVDACLHTGGSTRQLYFDVCKFLGVKP